MTAVISRERVTLKPGQTRRITLPHSEVCMHMKVSGKSMRVKLLADGRFAQLYLDNGDPFSFPITRGEAGIYLNAGVYSAHHEQAP